MRSPLTRSRLDRCYLLPHELSVDARAVQLRLEPTKNNQAAGIRWARDYEFALNWIRSWGRSSAGRAPAGTQEARGSIPLGSIDRFKARLRSARE